MTRGADDVLVKPLGPIQLYVLAALGDVFKTIELSLQTVGSAGNVTVGKGFMVMVVVAEPGQSPTLAVTV